MTYYAYLFEAKSIQSYIFATSKLKEIIGGSELIEQLTAKNGLLKKTLDTRYRSFFILNPTLR